MEYLKCTHKVFGFVFDTSSCNTGVKRGACFLLQNILWFPCRQHVCEVILSHIWDCLKIEISKAPTINIFKKLHQINLQNFTREASVLIFSEKIILNMLNCVLSIQGLTLTYTLCKNQQSKMDVHNFVFFETSLVVNTNTTSEYCQGFSFTKTHTFH